MRIVCILEFSGYGNTHIAGTLNNDKKIISKKFPTSVLFSAWCLEELRIHNEKSTAFVAKLDDDGNVKMGDNGKPLLEQVEIYTYSSPEYTWFKEGKDHTSTKYSSLIEYQRWTKQNVYGYVFDDPSSLVVFLLEHGCDIEVADIKLIDEQFSDITTVYSLTIFPYRD